MYDHYPMGKYRYKRLSMEVANSPEKFQQRMIDLFHGFYFIYAYMDKLLVLTKVEWIDHVHHL